MAWNSGYRCDCEHLDHIFQLFGGTVLPRHSVLRADYILASWPPFFTMLCDGTIFSHQCSGKHIIAFLLLFGGTVFTRHSIIKADYIWCLSCMTSIHQYFVWWHHFWCNGEPSNYIFNILGCHLPAIKCSMVGSGGHECCIFLIADCWCQLAWMLPSLCFFCLKTWSMVIFPTSNLGSVSKIGYDF